MANCLIAHRIWSDDSGASFSGGSWEGTLPLSNLQDRRLERVARSSNALVTSTTFDIDLGATRKVQVIALLHHNLSLAATVRIYGDDAASFASPDYDSTATDAYPDIYPSSMPFWIPAASQDGALPQEDLDDGYRVDFIHIPSAAQECRYWRVAITDVANTDGYVQIGRLVIASGWQSTINFVPGATIGWRTSTVRTETDGGAAYYNAKDQRREANLTWENVPEDEAMVHLYEISRYAGTDRQVMFVYTPADTTHLHRRAFLATLEKLSPLQIPYGSWLGGGFALVEEL